MANKESVSASFSHVHCTLQTTEEVVAALLDSEDDSWLCYKLLRRKLRRSR